MRVSALSSKWINYLYKAGLFGDIEQDIAQDSHEQEFTNCGISTARRTVERAISAPV